MKKIILVIMIMACYTSQISAQLKFGVKGGVNYTNFKVKDAQFSTSNSTSWQIGALMQTKVPILGMGVQPELLYTVYKADVNGRSNGIHYLQVPVNVFQSFNLLVVRPYLMAGPYFGYAVNIDGRAFKNQVDRFDWGIGLGGGIEIWKLQFGARYSWGLQNVSKVNEFKMRNNTFSLSLAYLF